jgi:uncharacterized protein (TIGR02246 family)
MDLAQVQSLIDRQARAWEAADPAAIVADFAPDALFISPSGRWQGRDQIRQVAADFFETVSHVEVEITHLIFSHDEGVIEWTWREVRRADGKRYQAEDAIIFRLAHDQIVYWREYFDTAQMAQPVA